jgi:hypothetical protein
MFLENLLEFSEILFLNTSSGDVNLVGMAESLIEDVHSVVDFVKL